MAKKKRCYKKRRSKLSSWKYLKSRFQFRRRFKLLGMAFLVILATLATLASLYLFRFITQPFVQAGNHPPTPFFWSGKSPVSFVWLVSSSQELKEFAVVHLNPGEGRAAFIRLHPDILGGRALGEMAPTLSEISRVLALPIRGYFLIDDASFPELKSILGVDTKWIGWGLQTLPKIPLLFPIFKEHAATNFSLREGFKVMSFVLGLRNDQKVEIGLGSSEDSVVEFCSDGKIRDEGARILILNGTSEAGLATRVARWVENLGGAVLDVGNAPQQNYERSVILALDPLSYTARSLALNLEVSDLRGIGANLDWAKRADIVLILGLDKKGFF